MPLASGNWEWINFNRQLDDHKVIFSWCIPCTLGQTRFTNWSDRPLFCRSGLTIFANSVLKIIFKFEHLAINKYLHNTTTRCTLLPVEMRWDLDASYDWLPKWKCLSTHESLYLKVPVIRLRSFLWVSKSATIFGRK
jgi:hypothetical protein